MRERLLQLLHSRQICGPEDIDVLQVLMVREEEEQQAAQGTEEQKLAFCCLRPLTIGECVHQIGEVLTAEATTECDGGLSIQCSGRRHLLPPVESFPRCDVEVYTSERVRPFGPLLSEYKAVLVKSAMNTQKTVEMVRTLSARFEENPALRVLVITPRIQLAQTLKGCLSGLNFRMYKDGSETEPWERCGRIIVQWESLWRMAGHCEPFDLIVMDEFRSLQETIVCKTTNRHKLFDNFEFFRSLVQCPQTTMLILDQDLSSQSTEFLTMLMRDMEWDRKLLCVQYNLHVNELKWEFLSNVDEFVSYILECWDRNEKIMIVSGSKVFLEKLHLVFDGRERPANAGHYAKGSGDMNDFMHIDEVWSDLDLVTFTPKVTVGASFNLENHFDRIFAYASDMTALPRTIIQMVGRCRYPRNRTVTVYVHRSNRKRKREYPETIEEVRDEMLRFVAATHSIVNGFYHRETGFRGRQFSVQQSPTALGFLNEVATLERNQGLNDYVTEMKRRIAHLGHDFADREYVTAPAAVASSPSSSQSSSSSAVPATQISDNNDDTEPVPLDHLVLQASQQMADARLALREQDCDDFNEADINLSREQYETVKLRCMHYNAKSEDLLVVMKYEYQQLWSHPIDAAHYFTHHKRVPMLKRICKLFRSKRNFNQFIQSTVSKAVQTKQFVDMYDSEATQAILLHNIVTTLGFKHLVDFETVIQASVARSLPVVQKLITVTTEIGTIFRQTRPFQPHNLDHVQFRHIFDYVNRVLHPWYGVKLIEVQRSSRDSKYRLGFPPLVDHKRKTLFEVLQYFKPFRDQQRSS
eukprot:GILJ01026124.1.p1 GENE.GILJ01026124.1~~GILJ01026124.1.p1  ORF type:complete len:810 (+),score=73.18 GILJ01026124.1:921-3350(+)